jgi:hypothetical protein
MTALTAMDKLLFWLGLGAAQKGARSKEVKPSRQAWTRSSASSTTCWKSCGPPRPSAIRRAGAIALTPLEHKRPISAAMHGLDLLQLPSCFLALG